VQFSGRVSISLGSRTVSLRMLPFRLVLRRAIGSALVLMGAAGLIFVISRLIPGDPARIALGPHATADEVEQLRRTMGLDQPIFIQFADFLRGLIHGDLGRSLYTSRPVATDLGTYFPATFELVLAATVIMVLAGIPLGALAARFRDEAIDGAVRILSLSGIAAPSFVWGIIFMLIFSYWLDWLPATGRLSAGLAVPPSVTGLLLVDSIFAGRFDAFVDALSHIILPATALSMAGLGQAARLTRTNMIETYGKPYIELARAFGLPGGLIAMRYALRPALVATLTVLGLDIAALLGNAFLVETVFNWPGLARYGVSAILNKDLNAIVGVVLVVAAFFLVVNILVDLGVAFVDPRIRTRAR
jgi:peptide/nickel transport system permease protein